jgi:hypothetical protein
LVVWISGFTKSWDIKQVEDFVVSSFFGKASSNIIKGIAKRAVKLYGVKSRKTEPS